MKAFKEWALICSALASGRQSIILRKGGISEDPAGFSFLHNNFLLYPTQYHQQAEKCKPFIPPTPLTPVNGQIHIHAKAELIHTAKLNNWQTIQKLDPFHLWLEDTIRERFQYDEANCIHLAILRIYTIQPLWLTPDLPEYGGCKSWIDLPEPPPNSQWIPALSDEQHQQQIQAIKQIIP